ncbi:MAG: hypothetical protein F7B61_01785 [Caldisphaeraceae archaeon]|nr:hypothetical protein [Caldisphaeraceae archaeon]
MGFTTKGEKGNDMPSYGPKKGTEPDDSQGFDRRKVVNAYERLSKLNPLNAAVLEIPNYISEGY